MSLPFTFAWRYFRAKKSTNAINIISWISMVAIMLGTASLILVLSVFNGFEDLVKSLYSSFYPDVKVSPAKGKTMVLTAAQLTQLRGMPEVAAVSLTAEEKALIVNEDLQTTVFLKGVDTAYATTSGVPAHMVSGVFTPGDSIDPRLILGVGVEYALRSAADRQLAPLTVYTGRRGDVDIANPLAALNSAVLPTAGSFAIQPEFDGRYVITNLHTVQGLLELTPDECTAAEIRLRTGVKAEDAVTRVQTVLGAGYRVDDRYAQNHSLFAIMEAEKWFIYCILSLLLVVLSFNLVGALTMLVLEKAPDIAVLHALGAERSLVQRIFLTEGLLLGLLGGGAGMALAYSVAWLQLTYKLIPMTGGSFMIDYYPVKLFGFDFALVGTTILLITLGAAWLPARRAARMQRTLREE